MSEGNKENVGFWEKYWMAIVLTAIPIILFLYITGNGINKTIFENDNPSIYDEEFKKDNYGGLD